MYIGNLVFIIGVFKGPNFICLCESHYLDNNMEIKYFLGGQIYFQVFFRVIFFFEVLPALQFTIGVLPLGSSHQRQVASFTAGCA